jgi:hypothetical protein
MAVPRAVRSTALLSGTVSRGSVVAFWSMGSNRGAAVAERATSPQEAAGARELEPIRIFTIDGEYAGTINPRGQRVTDLLNTQAALLVRLDEQSRGGPWVSIERDSILIVAPPPFISDRRIHRQRRTVQIKVGAWVVSGVAHTAPMGGLDPTQLRSRQPFLPLTNVRITRADGGADGEQFAVAIVNVSNVDELREVSLA